MQTSTLITKTKWITGKFFFRKAQNFSICSLLIGLLFIIGPKVYAQDAPTLPMLATPSPKASMMNQYGSYPVSLYTGLVDITIPIYEININGIKVPIEFKYHASGLKYDDMPMELGYGWTLMAGGTISHSVRGTPDGQSFSGQGMRASPYVFIKPAEEIEKYQNTGTGGASDNDQNSLADILNGITYPFSTINHSGYYKDGEYDEYDYNFVNHTGQAYNLDGNLIKVPANGLSVDFSAFHAPQFPVVDNDGISYFFSQMEEDEYGYNEVSYLTQIVSENKADTVVFNYTKNAFQVNRPTIYETYTIKDIQHLGSGENGYGLWDSQFDGNGRIGMDTKTFTPPRLNYIQYRGGKIEFIYSQAFSLSEIKIYDSRNNLIRSVALEKPRTDWLDGIDFRDSAGIVKQTYSFEYNDPPARPGRIDYWGYYNGGQVSSNANYIPDFTIPYQDNSLSGFSYYTIPGLDRSPDEGYMQSGILKKITYPSKGYTTFTYEAHRAENKIYGGLRIKEIQSFDANNNLLEKKWYKYGTNESGQGRPAVYLSTPDDPDFSEDFCDRSLLITELPGNGLGDEDFIRTYYPFPKMSYYTSGSSVVYPEVTEYSGTGTTPNGKTVYTYTDFPEQGGATNRGYSVNQQYKTYSWKNGLLLSKTVYDNTGKVVDSLANHYSYLFDSSILNLSVRQYADIVSTGGPLGDPNFEADLIKNSLGDTSDAAYMQFIYRVGGTLFDYYNYYISTGIPVLSTSTEYTDGVTKTTTYSDYNTIGLPGTMQVTDSKGDNYSTKYQYHYTTVSQKEQYKGTSLLSKSITQYKDWGNGMVEPGSVQFQQTPNAPLENRIVYRNRDRYGNPQYISKDSTDNIVYLWGYKGQYPVAEIKNATYDDVKNAIGGQTVIDRIANADVPAAADLALLNNLRSNAGFKTALVTTYTYAPLIGVTSETDPLGNIIHYEYDGYGRLTDAKDKDGRVIKRYDYGYAGQTRNYAGDTVYYNTEKTVTLTKNNCTAGIGGTVTYTVPAKKYGSVISQADADQMAQNDINTIGQNQANQSGDCIFSNVAKSGTFTRSTCAAGGQQVVYSVPAGRYTSTVSQQDADQMAINDVNANGQTYANANGTCSVYASTEQLGYFVKSNCVGHPGEGIYYTVSAGKYTSAVSQADADQKAINDVNANGQSYANQYGTCSTNNIYTFNITNYISGTPAVSTNFSIAIVGGNPGTTQTVSGNGGTGSVQIVTPPNSNASIVITFHPFSGSPAAHNVTISGPFGTKTVSPASDNTATFTGLNLTAPATISVTFN